MEPAPLAALANAVGPARPPSAGGLGAAGDAARQEGAPGGGPLRPPGKRTFDLQFK
jgi:hypothetical protein